MMKVRQMFKRMLLLSVFDIQQVARSKGVSARWDLSGRHAPWMARAEPVMDDVF
jgi:hypothetical protein